MSTQETINVHLGSGDAGRKLREKINKLAQKMCVKPTHLIRQIIVKYLSGTK